MLSSKQRSYLKSIANKIDSVFQVGKGGLTPEITKSIDTYLEVHEIVKINVLNNCEEDINFIGDAISARTQSDLVQIIGKKIVFYRASTKNPKILLPK